MKDIYHEEEVDASDILEHHMTKYVGYTIGAFFPNCIDGLLKIHQRIIEVFRKAKPGTSKKLSQWGGDVTNAHPHGDGSITQSMARLMQPFRHQIPLLEDQGDCGTYESPLGASPRYLEALSTPFLTDVYFDIEPAALYFRVSDGGNEIEPEYYIPKIPMALYLGTNGLATAYKTLIFPKDINEVCDLTAWYIDQVTSGKEEWLINNRFPLEVAHHLLPYFPIRNNILNKEQLLEAYSNGDYTHQIVMEGNYEVTQNTITIRNLPFGITYRKVVDDFINKLRKKDKSIRDIQDAMDAFRDLADGKMAVDFKLIFKKRHDVWEFLPKVLREFKLYKKTTPDPRFLVRENNQKLGPGQLLNMWYRERVRATLIKHNKEQDRQVKLLHIKEAQLILKDHIDETTDIFKGSKNKLEIIEKLQARFGISHFQAEQLSELKLVTLAQEERENILVEIEKIKFRINEITQAILNIPQLIKREVLDIKRKYGKVQKLTRYPEYCGYVKVNENNYVQIRDAVEALKKYDFDVFSVFLAPTVANKYRYRSNGYGKIDADKPSLFEKYFTSPYFTYCPVPAKYTVVINKGEQPTIFYSDNLYYITPGEDEIEKDFILAGDKITTITGGGLVRVIDTTSLPLRKSIQATGNMTTIIHMTNQAWERMVVFFVNDQDPNSMRASVIEGGTGKLNLRHDGTNHFYVFPVVPEPIMFQPHPSIFNRIPKYHIYIPNLMEFLGDCKNTIIDLSKKTCRHDKKTNIQFINMDN